MFITMIEKLIELVHDALNSVSWDWGDYPDVDGVADILIANGVTLDNQVSSSKWIPVSERLPGVYETVIVCDVREQYVGAWMYYGNDDWVYDDKMFDTGEITHWMPLPEPPKEEA